MNPYQNPQMVCLDCHYGRPCPKHDPNWRSRRPASLAQFDTWRMGCSEWYAAYLADSPAVPA